MPKMKTHRGAAKRFKVKERLLIEVICWNANLQKENGI